MNCDSERVTVYVHTGAGSVDNGALYPLSLFREIGQAAQCEIVYGSHYGDDRLVVDPRDLDTVEQMLIEQKMLYRRHGMDAGWRNIQPGSAFDDYCKRLAAKS